MSTTQRSESMNVFFLWLCGSEDYIEIILIFNLYPNAHLMYWV